jgi:hypothetical protein
MTVFLAKPVMMSSLAKKATIFSSAAMGQTH